MNKENDDAWRFIGFYGERITHLRHESWSLLRDLNKRMSLPLLCSDDFIELVDHWEKLGRANKNRNQMQLFQNTIDECSFLYLGFVGLKFTWQKHFADGHSIWERQDWGIANNDWLMIFSGTRLHHLRSNSSNHSPIWIMLASMEPPRFQKPFRFKEMWFSDTGYTDTVEVVWSSQVSSDPFIRTMYKVDKCGKKLKWWSQKNFCTV